MAEVKWIKIATDIFDDDKILLIESMPEADAIIVIWFKLLCLAGKQNNKGAFQVDKRIAYTEEMFSAVFHRDAETIHNALGKLKELGMIDDSDGVISIKNWGRNSVVNNKQHLRFIPEYKEWRKAVFERDNYTCQHCLQRGCRLNAHHIMPFARYPELRFSVNNGISLCESCHKKVHRKEK